MSSYRKPSNGKWWPCFATKTQLVTMLMKKKHTHTRNTCPQIVMHGVCPVSNREFSALGANFIVGEPWEWLTVTLPRHMQNYSFIRKSTHALWCVCVSGTSSCAQISNIFHPRNCYVALTHTIKQVLYCSYNWQDRSVLLNQHKITVGTILSNAMKRPLRFRCI